MIIGLLKKVWFGLMGKERPPKMDTMWGKENYHAKMITAYIVAGINFASPHKNHLNLKVFFMTGFSMENFS